MTFWQWLVQGSDEQYMSETWLADRERLREYEAFTERQKAACVSAGALEMKRRTLWEKANAPLEPRTLGKVVRGRFPS